MHCLALVSLYPVPGSTPVALCTWSALHWSVATPVAGLVLHLDHGQPLGLAPCINNRSGSLEGVTLAGVAQSLGFLKFLQFQTKFPKVHRE